MELDPPNRKRGCQIRNEVIMRTLGVVNYLILELCSEEEVDDLSLLDGQREEVDLLNSLDHTVLDQTSQLSTREPFLGVT